MNANCYELPVREIIRLSKTAVAVRVNLDWKNFDFKPGQFAQMEINLQEGGDFKILDGKPCVQKRCYSITSSPNERRYLEFTVKEVHDGFVSRYIVNCLQVGDIVKIGGPFGNFYLDENAKNIMFIAAGSGIAPAMSMMRHIDEKGLEINSILLYSNKTEEDILWKGEIEWLARKDAHVKYIFTLTQQQWGGRMGRIDKELVFANCDKNKTVFYLCGPPPFVNEMERMLKENGVEDVRVKRETF